MECGNKMIVYHGSNANFKQLRISSSLVKRESTKTNEGMGIYFSTNKEVAKSYGKYLYTLEINDKYFKDFRRRTICRLHIAEVAKKIYKELKIDILEYINMQEISERMYWGGQAICSVGREIYLLLDSNEKWYKLHQYKIDRVYQILRAYDKKSLKVYMFNYHIKDIGVIKDVSEDVVRIVNKEKLY